MPGAVARVNLLRPAFHPFVPLALAAFAAKTAFLTAAPLLLLPLSVSALDSESAQSEWDALLRSLRSPESRSHLGRIRLPQDAEACIQAAGTPGEHRVCGRQEAAAREALRAELRREREALRERLQRLRVGYGRNADRAD